MYLGQLAEQALPKSALGKAVTYARKNWTALTRYCSDGDLEIDNNRTERAVRGIAVGRRNWLFVGSPRGGRTNAILSTLVATCQRCRVDPFAWFSDVLGRIADHPVNAVDQLLPHRWAPRPSA
jgi:transposase